MDKSLQLVLSIGLVASFCQAFPGLAQDKTQDKTCFTYASEKAEARDVFEEQFGSRIAKQKLPCEYIPLGKPDDPLAGPGTDHKRKDADKVKERKQRDKVLFSCDINASSAEEAISAVFAAVGQSFEFATKYNSPATTLTTQACGSGCIPWSCPGMPATCWRVRCAVPC